MEKGNPKGVTDVADLAKADLLVVLCADTVPCGSPAWHVSETDVIPADPASVEDEMSPADRLADSEVAVTSKTPDPRVASSASGGDSDGRP